jgi:hypothetical protein
VVSSKNTGRARTSDVHILQIFPANAAAQAYSIEELLTLGQALGSVNADRVLRVAIPPVTNVVDFDLIRDVSQFVRAALDASSILLVDFGFDQTLPRAYAAADLILSLALADCAGSATDKSQIVVLVESRPAPTDEISELASSEPFSRCMAFVAHEGKRASSKDGPMNDIVRNLKRAVRLTPAGRRAVIKGGTLRTRGVFKARLGDHFYKFHYDALPDITDALTEALELQLKEIDPDLVLFAQGSAGPWFRSCLQAACNHHGIMTLDAQVIGKGRTSIADEEAIAVDRASTLVGDGRKVCLAVPAFKSGVSIFEAFRTLYSEPYERDLNILTVYFDSRGAGSRAKAVGSGFRRTVKWAGGVATLDYLVDVPIDMFEQSDWEVRAALQLAEVVETPSYPAAAQSKVAFWTLFAKCGASIERPVPKGRRAVSVFPRLWDVDEWDAMWLAEGLFALAEEKLGGHRSQLLVVLPDEGSGAEPLARAIRSRGHTAIVPISRKIIDGQEPLTARHKKQLRDFSIGAKVVVADESTITQGTLARLGEIVRSELNRGPDLYAVVIDLSGDRSQLDRELVSLLRWTPLRWTPVRTEAS